MRLTTVMQSSPEISANCRDLDSYKPSKCSLNEFPPMFLDVFEIDFYTHKITLVFTLSRHPIHS